MVLLLIMFQLDFEVQYKVLETDQLQKLFSHTLVPMLSVEYSEELCVKPGNRTLGRELYQACETCSVRGIFNNLVKPVYGKI